MLWIAAEEGWANIWNKPIDVGDGSWSALREHRLAMLFGNFKMLSILIIEQIKIVDLQLLRSKRSWSRKISVILIFWRAFFLKQLKINLLKLLALAISGGLTLTLISGTLCFFLMPIFAILWMMLILLRHFNYKLIRLHHKLIAFII